MRVSHRPRFINARTEAAVKAAAKMIAIRIAATTARLPSTVSMKPGSLGVGPGASTASAIA